MFPLNLARVEVSRVQTPHAYVLTFWSEDGWTTPYTYYLFSGQLPTVPHSYVGNDGMIHHIDEFGVMTLDFG